MSFEHHKFNDTKQFHSNVIIEAAKVLDAAINNWCPDSREKSLAKTNLEQAVMWANKCIAIHDSEE